MTGKMEWKIPSVRFQILLNGFNAKNDAKWE